MLQEEYPSNRQEITFHLTEWPSRLLQTVTREGELGDDPTPLKVLGERTMAKAPERTASPGQNKIFSETQA